ncbi:MAG: helix-turn-helix transcriptional regulator [Rubrivivax sp.]
MERRQCAGRCAGSPSGRALRLRHHRRHREPRIAMTPRHPPSWDDVEQVVRLLGEVAGMAAPIVARRRRLMQGLAELVGADVWAWVHLRVPASGMAVAFRAMDGGWIDDEQSRAIAAANRPEGNEVPMAWARLACREGRIVTAAMSAPAAVDRHPVSIEAMARHGELARTIGIGDQIFSHHPLSGDTASLIGLHRRLGHANFSDRELQLVHLVAGRIDWLHRDGADVPANADPLLSLTPRERQLLLLETGGASRKQIAAMASLSAHTVSDHFKNIYRKLGVRSQSELMALFISGPPTLP